MAQKTYEERMAELEKQKAQIIERQKRLKAKHTAENRKARNHRLIQIGAIVEAYAGEITDLNTFESYVKQYATAIRNTQN